VREIETEVATAAAIEVAADIAAATAARDEAARRDAIAAIDLRGWPAIQSRVL
jgi:hypothetical protein